MAPKNKFTKQQLIDTAFDIANEDGFESITIRRIAERLGSSIAPIYGNFKDVEELKSEVIKKVGEMYRKMSGEQNSGNTFLDIGVAGIAFSKKYPLLFEDIILKHGRNIQWFTGVNAFALEQMKHDACLSQFNDTELSQLLLEMQAFQIGLSVLAGNQSYANIITEEKIIEMLKSMGKAVISEMASHKGGNQNGTHKNLPQLQFGNN